MNKGELIKIVSEKLSVKPKEVKCILEATGNVLADTIREGESITLKDFGVFTLWQQTERMGRNPKTGRLVLIKKRNSIKFKPGGRLLRNLND